MAKKVLIIEDEADILTYLMAVMEDLGLEPDTLTSEASLAQSITSARPDLVLLDVMMPKRSGVSIYQELRTSDELCDIPVIIISGFSPESGNMADNFKNLIADNAIPAPNGFIDKPMNLERLIDMVHETLGMARQGT